MRSEILLETRGLSKNFGGFAALRDVDLRVARGSIHALIGPNGAGKTTCFNLVSKFLQPTGGRILFDGRDVTPLRPADVARLGLVRSFQISAVFPHFTALQNVRVALQRRRGESLDFWRSGRVLSEFDAKALWHLEEVGLAGYAQTPAARLPYGAKRALEIATTLALEPELMLLDEPMAGLGREDIARVTTLIGRVAADRTVLMVEHNLAVVAALSHRITVLARGRVLAEGSYDEIARNPQVQEAYMGVGHG